MEKTQYKEVISLRRINMKNEKQDYVKIKRTPNCPKIDNFKEVMDWICYDWDYSYTLNKDNKGNFYVNKLYIEPTYLTYKTECSELADGLFDRVQQLYKVINEK